jgi:hypothetical protein
MILKDYNTLKIITQRIKLRAWEVQPIILYQIIYQIGMYRQGLVKLPNLKFYEKVSGGYRNVSCRQADS